MNDLELALATLADAVAERVARRLAEDQRGWVDQAASPLGRRRHIAMVRRLHDSGDSSVAIVGRKHLASRATVDAELVRIGKRPNRQESELEALGAELGLRVLGGGR